MVTVQDILGKLGLVCGKVYISNRLHILENPRAGLILIGDTISAGSCQPEERTVFSHTPWSSYLRLIKFRYHINYLGVVFGALIFAEELTASLAAALAYLYVSFNVLLYGGIYTLNDIADLPSDGAHPTKRLRPLASGMISLKSARNFSFAMISLGLLTGGLLFGKWIVISYLLFLSINLSYSFFARNVAYLELFVNSITHPLRFLMGVFLVRDGIPWLHLLSYFFLVFAVVSLRRLIEMEVQGWHARRTLAYYPRRCLSFLMLSPCAAVLLLFAGNGFGSRGFYSIVISVYLVLILGPRLSSHARRGQIGRAHV